MERMAVAKVTMGRWELLFRDFYKVSVMQIKQVLVTLGTISCLY